MNVIDLETPLNTEKYLAPETTNEYPFYITEYGKTFKNVPCYQVRMESPVGCVQFVISGSGIIICNNKIYAVKMGDTFLLPEGSNQIYYSNPDNQFERIWINFKGALSKALLDIYKINDIVVFRNVNSVEIIDEIQKKCRELINSEEYKNQTSQLFLKLVQFLSESKPKEIKESEATEQIRLYIDCRITENIKVADIGKKFLFSPEHIIRMFKRTYGITPHQYILQSKMRSAMIMLKTTQMSIEEIADKLNFTDSHHFSSQFKRLIGYSPSLYRKK